MKRGGIIISPCASVQLSEITTDYNLFSLFFFFFLDFLILA